MRLPREAYPIRDAVAARLPTLRPAQCEGLAWWAYGAVLAGSACQSAVVTALEPVIGAGALDAARQRLREWLYDGADRVAPCATDLDVAACFPDLLAWVAAWWHGEGALPLALDATALGDRLVVLAIAVRSRGCAL